MQERAARDHPSPVLTAEHVRHLLIERNGDMGAAGGAIGGAIGGSVSGALAGAAGSVGGASGGRVGGRIGARLFTRVKGLSRTLPVPCTDEALARARGALALVDVPGTPSTVLVGIIGAGALDMNSAVVQLVWHPDRVEATAHALEGIVDQRTAADAIGKIETTLSAG